jgi:hypothetical protein
MPPIFQGDLFSIVREGNILHVLTGDTVRWTIDPSHFGNRARVDVSRKTDLVEITMSQAFFAGTTLPASFRLVLARLHGTWKMAMSADFGASLSAGWMDWLYGKSSAVGRWDAQTLRPFPALALSLLPGALVQFTPDWNYAVSGMVLVTIDGLLHEFASSKWQMHAGQMASLYANPSERQASPATTFTFHRQSASWPVSLMRSSIDGWSLDHEQGDELFDELRVEAAAGPQAHVHTALLTQSSENHTPIRFFPGGGLSTTFGEPFHLTLRSPRLAFALSDATLKSAFIADFDAATTWAHSDHISVAFTSTADDEPFELHESIDAPSMPKAAPCITEVYIPSPGTSCMKLAFDKPRPTPFNWAKFVQPFERFLGFFHFLPWEHAAAFDLTCGDVLSVVRPDDMLTLKYSFQNMRLYTCFASDIKPNSQTKGAAPGSQSGPGPHLECSATGTARITVTFPPQHVNEEAFFHDDDQDPPLPNGQKINFKLSKYRVDDNKVAEVSRLSKGKYNDIKAVQGLLDPDVPSDGNNGSKIAKADHDSLPPEKAPETVMAGETNLVFELDPSIKKIPFHLENLLDWSAWNPVVDDVAKTTIPAVKQNAITTDLGVVRQHTHIELPYRLFLSPSDKGRWAHSQTAVTHCSTNVELWHTRLAVATPGSGAPDEANSKDRVARAIYTPDILPGIPPEQETLAVHQSAAPRFALDCRDRQELVHLTSDFKQLESVAADKPQLPYVPYIPTPIDLEHLMLTSQGGYLKSNGTWEPPKFKSTNALPTDRVLTLEQWKNVTTLGRDQYVRVVYKGFLAPFAHRASLVKVTERKLVQHTSDPKFWFAVLHQRMFIVVHVPRRDFPLFVHPNAGRDFPFRRIDILTTVTPDLCQPGNQSLFWPMAPDAADKPTIFRFRYRFWDMENRVTEASLPAVFGDAGQSQTAVGIGAMVDLYNKGNTNPVPGHSSDTDRDYPIDQSWISTPFNDQTIAFAPTTTPGDTRYDADRLRWQITNLSGSNDDLIYRHNLPLFAPSMLDAKITSSSIKRVTGSSDPKWVRFFKTYVADGFDAVKNKGEVLLQADDPTSLTLKFGGSGKADQSGGLASPDALVVGFSRKSGPVGGTSQPVPAPPPPPPPGAPPASVSTAPEPHPSLATYSGGNFSAPDFFGGLTSAKILGAVRLSDIIAPLLGGMDSNIANAPRMVEQALFKAEKELGTFEDRIVGFIKTFQTYQPSPDVPNIIAQRLAAPAQAVYARKAAVDAAVKENVDPILIAPLHASLISGIVAYADALNNLIQDPSALVSDELGLIVQNLIDHNQAFAYFTASVQAGLNAVIGNLVATVQPAIQSVIAGFLTDLQKLAGLVVADPLFVQTLDGAAKAERHLRDLTPEIIALLDALPVAQKVLTDLNNMPGTVTIANLPIVLSHLETVGADLLSLNQALGPFGVLIATPAAIDQAKTAIGQLITIWDTGKTVAKVPGVAATQLAAPVKQLHDACVTLAAAPSYPSGSATALLQSLRQVERALGKLDQLRIDFPAFRVKPPSATEYDKVYRWLQNQQVIQRQLLANIGALQTMALDALKNDDQTISTYGAQLVNFLSEGATAFIDAVTCFLQLEANAVENTVHAFLDAVPALKPLVKTQLDGFTSGMTVVRTDIAKQRKASSEAINAYRAAATSSATRAALYNACSVAFPAALKARTTLLDLSTRYQSSINLVIGWTAWVVGKISAADTAALATLTTATNTFTTPMAGLLRTISTTGRQLNDTINVTVPINTVFTDVAKPLAALPAPADGAGISELLTDFQTVISSTNAFLAAVQQRAISVTKSLPTLDDAKKLALQVLEGLPIPQTVSLSYVWAPQIKSFEPVFILKKGAAFTVQASFVADVLGGKPPQVSIQGKLTSFSINLIGSPSFVIVNVKTLTFTSTNGNKPDCRLIIDTVDFGEALSFVKELAAALNPANGPFLEFAGTSIRAGFRFHVPNMTVGAFTLMQLAIEVAVSLSFNGDPVRCQFGLSDENHPFMLSAGIYGGGGFLQLQLGMDGVQSLEGALEFGLVAAISIGPVSGYGYVVAGIYFSIAGDQSKVCGFVHAHGHMDIFGIISMDIDLYVGLCYGPSGHVHGLAKFSVSVHILFFSADYHMQAEYDFAGSGSGASPNALNAPAPVLFHDPQAIPPPVFADNFVSPERWAARFDAFA